MQPVSLLASQRFFPQDAGQANKTNLWLVVSTIPAKTEEVNPGGSVI
jgi:hypothetical protein